MRGMVSALRLTSPLQQAIDELFERFRALDAGRVAGYIPELLRADPTHFGICLMTANGDTYCAGDVDVPFTIQSISKAFVYALALEDQGVSRVLATVGVEPSGEPFNAISLESGSGRPRNPMINAGAIATTSLIAGRDAAERLERTLRALGEFAGRPLDLDVEVYRSERDTGHRNRAIAYMLRNSDIVGDDVDEVLDRYFRQCSVLVTASDLAAMAATLASGGLHPVTGRRVVSRDNVSEVLSVMSSCGMYDYSGSWLYRVGMPAKSGVGGGIIAVLPGQFGLAVFSPPLDDVGNSVRGVAVCEALSDRFGLHLLDPPLSTSDVVISSHTITDLRSTRRRSARELEALTRHGERAHVFRLQGRFVFSTAEAALQRIIAEAGDGDTIVLDCRRVHDVEPAAWALFQTFMKDFASMGGAVRVASLAVLLPQAMADQFDALDAALEWAEARVLGSIGVDDSLRGIDIDDHAAVQYLDANERAELMKALAPVRVPAGGMLLRRGIPSAGVYLLLQGDVSATIEVGEGRRHRLAVIGPGAMFGEMSFVDGEPAVADVIAETDVAGYLLRVEAMPQLSAEVRGKLLASIARDLAVRLRRADEQIGALAL
jgi:glutaminase